MATESHVWQHEGVAIESHVYGNRKPYMSIESHVCQKKACVAIERRVLQQKAREPIVATDSLVWQQKQCVARESMD
jgi:hypothetical protein